MFVPFKNAIALGRHSQAAGLGIADAIRRTGFRRLAHQTAYTCPHVRRTTSPNTKDDAYVPAKDLRSFLTVNAQSQGPAIRGQGRGGNRVIRGPHARETTDIAG
jgi:hypothetical protein